MNIFKAGSAKVDSGVVVLGVFPDIASIIKEIKKEVAQEVGEDCPELKVTAEELTLLTQSDVSKRGATFDLQKKFDERSYRLVVWDEALLLNNCTAVIALLAEKRPLKLVPILIVRSLARLPGNLRDAITGNVGCFVFGELMPQDKKFLATLYPAIQAKDLNNSYR